MLQKLIQLHAASWPYRQNESLDYAIERRESFHAEGPCCASKHMPSLPAYADSELP